MERVPGQWTRITFRWWLREMLGSAVGALLLALLLEFVLLGQGRIERVPLIWGVSFACGQAAGLLTLFWYYLRGRRAAAMTDNGAWREKSESGSAPEQGHRQVRSVPSRWPMSGGWSRRRSCPQRGSEGGPGANWPAGDAVFFRGRIGRVMGRIAAALAMLGDNNAERAARYRAGAAWPRGRRFRCGWR